MFSYLHGKQQMDFANTDLINSSATTVKHSQRSHLPWLKHRGAQRSTTDVTLARTRLALLNIKEQNPDKCCFHSRLR